MRNDIQDKQYLALELTKIGYGNNGNDFSDENICDSYEYYLKRLTDTLDKINEFESLKNEIAKLQKENEQLKFNNQDNYKPLITDILTLCDGCKKDMEPYVYEAIISNCKRYEI